MKPTKHLIRICLTALFMLSCTYAAMAGERGEKSVGVAAGYNTRNNSAIAGIFFQYRCGKFVRLAPDITYLFRHDDTDGLALNFNVQFPFTLGNSSRVNFYPLAGLNYTSWNMHPRNIHPTITENDDVSNRINKLGFNIGGGFDFHVTRTLKLFIEGRYTGVRNYSFGTFGAGIGYTF